MLDLKQVFKEKVKELGEEQVAFRLLEYERMRTARRKQLDTAKVRRGRERKMIEYAKMTGFKEVAGDDDMDLGGETE